jgi:hypothetical protein
MQKIVCVLVAAAMSCGALAQGSSPIKYQTVARALADLKAKKDNTVSIRDGWTIIDDKAANAVWSFVPPGHPAYPAVVRRAAVVRDGKAGTATVSLCQSGKKACDNLMAEFERKTTQAPQEVRARTYDAKGKPVSHLDVERLADDEFLLVLTSFTSKTAQAGQQELQSQAQQLCGTKAASFGKYEFNLLESFSDGGKDKGNLLLKQHLRCGDAQAAPAASAASPAAPAFVASAEQIGRVEQASRLYFAARDQGRYAEAYALLSPVEKDITPFGRWQQRAQEFNARAGAPGERSIKKITWYRNPPEGAPGIYAAVDFDGRFANVALHCGYLAWQAQQDGSFLLVREEENVLDKAVADKLKPAEMDKVRATFGCRG